MTAMRALFPFFCACAVGGSVGCGSSFIILRIDAELTIPTQANSLQVTSFDAADLSRVLADVDLTLSSGDEFPMDVLLEPSADTPAEVRERVTARLDGVPVAQNEVEHEWEPHRTNIASFTLEPVTP
jgi:hypothetical protein